MSGKIASDLLDGLKAYYVHPINEQKEAPQKIEYLLFQDLMREENLFA